MAQIKIYIFLFIALFCLLFFLIFTYSFLYFYFFKKIYYYLIVINKKQKSSPFLVIILNFEKNKNFQFKNKNLFFLNKMNCWKKFFISFYCKKIFNISKELEKLSKKKIWNILNLFKSIRLYILIKKYYQEYVKVEANILLNLKFNRDINSFYTVQYFHFQKIKEIYDLYFQKIEKYNLNSKVIENNLKKIIAKKEIDFNKINLKLRFFLENKKHKIYFLNENLNFNNFVKFVDLFTLYTNFFEYDLNQKILKINEILFEFKKNNHFIEKDFEVRFQNLLKKFLNFSDHKVVQEKKKIINSLIEYKFQKATFEFNEFKQFLTKWFDDFFNVEFNAFICFYFAKKFLSIYKLFFNCYQNHLTNCLNFKKVIFKNSILKEQIKNIKDIFKNKVIFYNHVLENITFENTKFNEKKIYSKLFEIFIFIKKEYNNILFLNSFSITNKEINLISPINFKNSLILNNLNNAIILVEKFKFLNLRKYFYKKLIQNFYHCNYLISLNTKELTFQENYKYLNWINNCSKILKNFKNCLIFYEILYIVASKNLEFVNNNEMLYQHFLQAQNYYHANNFEMFLNSMILVARTKNEI